MFVPIDKRHDGDGLQINKIDQALMAAEDILLREGWAHGNPVAQGLSGRCIGQAIAMAAFDRKVHYFQLQALLLQAASIQTGKQWPAIPQYNDAPERTVEDVWNLFSVARNLATA